jgi:hypothetical protein
VAGLRFVCFDLTGVNGPGEGLGGLVRPIDKRHAHFSASVLILAMDLDQHLGDEDEVLTSVGAG